MTPLDASLSGTFAIGGDMPVARLGFGAMRITGEGIWGPPPNREGALATLRKLPEFGVDFIDTAGAGFDEELEPDGESRLNRGEARLRSIRFPVCC